MRTLTKLFANIKNGQRAGKSIIKTPFSKSSMEILNLLFLEGFICGYGRKDCKNIETYGKPDISFIYILLKYKNSQPVIKDIKQISSSGCRVYKRVKCLESSNSFEFIILSTPKGIISHKTAMSLNVGGEVLCKVI